MIVEVDPLADARPLADPDAEAHDALVKRLGVTWLVMADLAAAIKADPNLPAAVVHSRIAGVLPDVPKETK